MKLLLNINILVSIVLLSVASLGAQASNCPDLLKFVKRKLNSQDTVYV
jgi:glutathione peroxidase